MTGDARVGNPRAIAAGQAVGSPTATLGSCRLQENELCIPSTLGRLRRGQFGTGSIRSALTRVRRRVVLESVQVGQAIRGKIAQFVRPQSEYQEAKLFLRVVTILSGCIFFMLGSAIMAPAHQAKQEQQKPVEEADPPPDEAPLGAVMPEAELEEAVAELVHQAEYALASNTAEMWLGRISMPQVVFDALDAFLSAFRAPRNTEETAKQQERREVWLRRAMENWHGSPDYRDDAGYPMTPLRSGQREARQRLFRVLADPARGELVARDLAEMSRLQWFMAIARSPADSPNSCTLPAGVVRDALDAYFAVDGEGTLESGVIPLYPDLHLIAETVLRASVAHFQPVYEHYRLWVHGLPVPVKAALDALG
jgi:hypothetical protein